MILEETLSERLIREEQQFKESEHNVNLFSLEAENYYRLFSLWNENNNGKLFIESFEEFYSEESAFSKNPYLIRNAFLRTSMLFRYNKDISIMEYLKSLSHLDVNSIDRGTSSTVFNYENIAAFNEIMKMINSFGNIKGEEIENIIDQVSNEIDGFYTKCNMAIVMSAIPILGLVAAIMLLIEIKNVVDYSSEMNAKYSDKLMDMLIKSLSQSELKNKIGKPISKSNIMETISALTSYLNKQRQIMYPSKIKNSLRPKMLKQKQIITYEEKVKVVNFLKHNYSNYMTALASGPYSKIDAARLIFKGADIENTSNFGYYVNSITDSSAMGDLLFNLLLTVMELTDFVIILVQDLKRY